MSLFDDDPLDALEYTDDSEDSEGEEATAADANSLPVPAAPTTAAAPAPAPAEEGVPPSTGGGGPSMFDQDPLADLGVDMGAGTDESLGSGMKGRARSFSAGIRSRSSSDAAQRMRGMTAAASTKAQEKAQAAQEKAKAATETLAASVRSARAVPFVVQSCVSPTSKRCMQGGGDRLVGGLTSSMAVARASVTKVTDAAIDNTKAVAATSSGLLHDASSSLKEATEKTLSEEQTFNSFKKGSVMTTKGLNRVKQMTLDMAGACRTTRVHSVSLLLKSS